MVTTGNFLDSMSGAAPIHVPIAAAPTDVPAPKSELERYLALECPAEGKSLNLLLWWKGKEKDFPNLARMARQFLAHPATSASVERMFSLVGRMFGDLQKAVKETTFQENLFAQNIRKQ